MTELIHADELRGANKINESEFNRLVLKANDDRITFIRINANEFSGQMIGKIKKSGYQVSFLSGTNTYTISW